MRELSNDRRARRIGSFFLVLMLLISGLIPAQPVRAKADMKIDSASRILYLGGSDISGTADEYDFYIKNKPSDYKKLYTFTWTSSKKKVATVNSAGLVKAIGTGKTTITCTITLKETGETVLETSAAVTVKQNAKAVKISGYPEDKTAVVGETVDFSRKMTPKTGKSTATDKTKWVLTNNTADARVTQSNGKVKASQPGSYTITAYTYQSASYPLTEEENGEYTGYTAVSNSITITVIDQETADTQDDYAEQILKLVNEERKKAGVPELVMDDAVTEVANLRAKELVTLFSHTRPDGQDCFSAITEAGISYRGLGENIAYGYQTPEAVMKGWMNSEGHRENILYEAFDGIGVGYYVENGRAYWVQMFIAY